jgi:integrase
MASVEEWTPHPVTGKPRWRARWRTPEGKPRSKVCDRKRDAVAYGAKMETTKLVGGYIDPAAGKVTFRTYAEQWLAAQVFDESSRTAVASRLKHAWPTLGPMRIAAIRPSTVQAWLSGIDRAPATTRVILTHVSSIFSAAVDDGLIARNPCAAKSVKATRGVQEKVQPFTAAEVHAIVDGIDDARYRAIPVVAAGCGLRQGEVLGLRKSDVDWLGRWLHVRRKLKQAKGGPKFDLPKGRKVRKVPLPDWVGVELAEHVRRHPVDEDDGLLFTSAAGTAIRHNTFNATVWKPALRSAGVDDADRRNGMHRARHTFASVLLHEGESVAAVAEWMGNTPAVVLRTYAHLMPASEDRTRRVIDAAFSTSGVTSVSLGGRHLR